MIRKGRGFINVLVMMLKKSDTMVTMVTMEVIRVATGIGQPGCSQGPGLSHKNISQGGHLVSGSFRDSRVLTQWKERQSQCQNSEVKCLEVTW